MTKLWIQRTNDVGAAFAMDRGASAMVPGGSYRLFRLKAGDRLTIRDPQGLQAVALFTFGPGRFVDDPDGMAHRASPFETDAFETLGLAPSASRLVLSGAHGAGTAAELTARSDLTAMVSVPGAAMEPGKEGFASDILVEIAPARPHPAELPPPLAGPDTILLDRRIDAATATAYRVKAGDYIQIIDVDGRQCADFLAFDAAGLETGEEYDLDPTVTRTLMGQSFSCPGLHSKYFDRRMRPLVEIVQDTVGRHDTFLLACSAKYYEDMGYPGHSNCTDNFNACLKPFGVGPRMGWPAINFFYNTAVGTDDRISMDEPWSGPGDYVLLRALTDLVCATSSCADDIDPANAWQPTDIHLRVYDGARCAFAKGKAHRMTPDSEPRLTRESGFHPRISALTRNLVDYRGFWSATSYHAEGPIAEYWACRERAAVMDLSALRKFEVTGPDAEELMQLAVPRDMRRLSVGQVVYTPLLFEHGGMIDDGTVFRLGPLNFRLVCGEDYSGEWLRNLAGDRGLDAFVRASTDQLHNLALQGPLSARILDRVFVTPAHQPTLAELKWFRFTIGRIADAPVLVSRTGYTGELGFEIWCHPASAPRVWDAVIAAGTPEGLAPMGLDALDIVRIEAGLIFAGHDFSDETDPVEAGIGFAVPATSAEPYIGQGAVERKRANPARKLVGLRIAGAEPIGHGDGVYRGRARIGTVTSAAKSPLLKATIVLARLDAGTGDLGDAVEIGKLDGHRKRIAATIVPFPFYDPKKTRVRTDWAAERPETPA